MREGNIKYWYTLDLYYITTAVQLYDDDDNEVNDDDDYIQPMLYYKEKRH